MSRVRTLGHRCRFCACRRLRRPRRRRHEAERSQSTGQSQDRSFARRSLDLRGSRRHHGRAEDHPRFRRDRRHRFRDRHQGALHQRRDQRRNDRRASIRSALAAEGQRRAIYRPAARANWNPSRISRSARRGLTASSCRGSIRPPTSSLPAKPKWFPGNASPSRNGLAYDAFKIVFNSAVTPVVNNRKWEEHVELWYAPAANRYVKRSL